MFSKDAPGVALVTVSVCTEVPAAIVLAPRWADCCRTPDTNSTTVQLQTIAESPSATPVLKVKAVAEVSLTIC